MGVSDLPQAGTAGRLLAFAVIGGVAAINSRFGGVSGIYADYGLAASLFLLLEVGAVIWFAIFAAWSIALSDNGQTPYRRGDLSVLALMLLAAFFPSPVAAIFCSLAGALWLMASSAPGSTARRLAILLVAIPAQQILSRMFLALFAEPLLQADVELVGFFVGLQAHDNVIAQVGGGQLIVMAGCSSFRNLSFAALAWVAAIQLFKLPLVPRLGLYAGISLVTLVLLNTARLIAMAWYPEHFIFLHEGGGVVLFGWGGFLIIFGLIVQAVLKLAPRAARG